MSTQTVDWVAREVTGVPAEGLRARKKRLMRQQLSDTATRMFVERGFDAVRVAEVAETCGVSEKTVFNYFPTKESLVLDRLEATMASLRTGLAEPAVSPVQAALRILDRELSAMTGWLAGQGDPAVRRPDPRHAVAAGLSERQDGPVRGRGRADPGRPGRDAARRPRTADRGPRAAGTLARPGREPAPAPRQPTAARAGHGRRPPGGAANRERAGLVRGRWLGSGRA